MRLQPAARKAARRLAHPAIALEDPMLARNLLEILAQERIQHPIHGAKQGEEIVVTERGRPVAVIQPIESAHPIRSLDAKLARLAAQGRVSLPTRALLKRVRLVRVRGSRIAQTVVEDRR